MRLSLLLHEVPSINKQQIKSTITLDVFHLVLEYVFYPEKREQLYASLGLLFQGLNAADAGKIFRVLIEYLLSTTDISPTEVEEHVRHLPGVETVKTTKEKKTADPEKLRNQPAHT